MQIKQVIHKEYHDSIYGALGLHPYVKAKLANPPDFINEMVGIKRTNAYMERLALRVAAITVRYRGVNVFLLHMLGYASPWFLSMKQVNAMGGKVRKGEKSCPVVFWRIVEPKEDDPKKGYAVLRYYRVFNVEQCEGLPASKVPVIEVPTRTHTPLEIAENLVAMMPNPPKINHARTLASYSPSMDVVSMPSPEWFTSGEEYYGALFHELCHSVGAASRIGRKAIMEPTNFGSHAYSQEELVAEMTSAFLCGYTGILLCTEKN